MRQVYSYAICAISMIYGAVSIGMGVWGALSIYHPEITIRGWRWNEVETLQNFRSNVKNKKEMKELSDEEIKMRWEEARAQAIKGEVRQGIQEVIRALISLAIVVPVFISHWLLGRKTSPPGV